MKSSVQLTSFLFILAFFCIVKANVCPDGSTCSGSMTCCHFPEGGYGCCPYAAGVCCANGHYCCPAGTTCVPQQHMCVRSPSNDTSSLTKISVARSTIKSIQSRAPSCRDDETLCDNNTCCPLPDAVCCRDGAHCCPQGTVCNMQIQKCIHSGTGDVITDLIKNKYSDVGSLNLKNVPCGGSSCQDGETCCNDDSCCPLSNAVCCSDGRHCCSENTECDLATQRCIRKELTALVVETRTLSSVKSLQNEIATIVRKGQVKINYCPGGAVYCQDQQTCCLLPNGQWGCCPFPSAFCCADRLHCCPYGKHCDATYTQCIQNGNSVPSQKKYKAFPVEKLLNKYNEQ